MNQHRAPSLLALAVACHVCGPFLSGRMSTEQALMCPHCGAPDNAKTGSLSRFICFLGPVPENHSCPSCCWLVFASTIGQCIPIPTHPRASAYAIPVPMPPSRGVSCGCPLPTGVPPFHIVVLPPFPPPAAKGHTPCVHWKGREPFCVLERLSKLCIPVLPLPALREYDALSSPRSAIGQPSGSP
jgi:hypothetical protein